MGQYFNQPSFAAGEIAPELYGRVDQELYYIGLRTCRNFIVRQYGGVANRPGTQFIAECKGKTRIIPFQFNEEQTYIIELGHLYMRIIADGGEILETAVNITNATQANPVVITAAAHGFSNGQDVYITGVVGMVELNGRTFRVANAAANTFELKDYQGNNINGTAYGAYSSGGTAARVYTVTTPWDENDLFGINFTQSNDVITLCHNDYLVRDITRTAATAWTVTIFNNQEGPFKDKNTTATTVTASGVTGAITLTASAALFDSGMVGELFYLEQMPTDDTKTWEVAKSITAGDIRRAGFNYYSAVNTATTGTVRPSHTEGSATDGDNGVEWTYLHSGFGIAQITGFTSSTVVNATVIKRLPNKVTTVASTIWAKSAWSAAEGYPAAAAYHKQRLGFGGTKNQPNGLWLSAIGARNFFGKSNPVLDDEAITLLLDTTQVNAVRHLLPLKSLIVLTSASEQLVNGVDNVLSAVTPPVAEVQGYTGASTVAPIIVDNTAVFVQDMGSVVRSLAYQLESDTFTGIDLSARSPHLFRNKSIIDWSFQKYPLAVIWAVMNDGSLNGFTFMPEQKLYAWHRHDTDGLFESVASIREGNEIATYLVVKRTVNGVERRYIERFSSRYFATVRDAYFVDCGLSYDGRNYVEDADGIVSYRSAVTLTISGGTTWDSPEVLTVTASSAMFVASDVGNQIVFWTEDADGVKIALRLDITGFTSSTVVSAIPTRPLPVAYRNAARLDWEFGKKMFLSLNHLEGKAVAVLADGNVVEGLSVASGKVTLPDAAAVVHIGLPYVSDLETLDFAQPLGQNKAKTANFPLALVTVQETRKLVVANNAFTDESAASKFIEAKQRSPGIGYDAPIPAETLVFEVNLNSSWSRQGRFCIRQDAPLPVTVNCITLEGVGGYNG